MLISVDRWEELVPEPLLKYVRLDILFRYPTGIGRDEKSGWYIEMGGQGSFRHWEEKKDGWEKIEQYNATQKERAVDAIMGGFRNMERWLSEPWRQRLFWKKLALKRESSL